jgi:hypothetical protein
MSDAFLIIRSEFKLFNCRYAFIERDFKYLNT